MRKIIISLICALVFIGCKNSSESTSEPFVHNKAKWTYAIYMAADNNLERFALKNIKEIKENLISNDVNFVVLLDRAKGYDRTEENWTDTKILELHHNTGISDDIIVELGEQDTTDILCLKNFLEFVLTYYPSEHFALNIWSHGFGVYPDCKINTSSRSFVQDYASSYSVEDSFSIIEFSQFLKTFNTMQKIDILQFDCCLMQMIEILWQLKDCADYIIGSQAELAGAGSNYSQLADTLHKGKTVKECAFNIVEDFKEKYQSSLISSTFSVCDMALFDDFEKDFTQFVSDLLNDDSIDYSKIRKAREGQFSYDSTCAEFVDFNSFLSIFYENLNSCPSLRKLSESYSLMNMNSFVSGSYVEQLTGIGINIPYNEKFFSFYNQATESYLDIYNQTALEKIINRIVFSEEK